MFRNLESLKNYSISLAAGNEYGVGPVTKQFVKTLATSMSKYITSDYHIILKYLKINYVIILYLFSVKYTPVPVNLFLVSAHEIFVKTKELIDTPISIYFTHQRINGTSIKYLQ